jgi:hypothetical protein
MPLTTICLRCGRPYFRRIGHRCGLRLRLPRTRAARLAAELAEIRDRLAEAEDMASGAATRADAILSGMKRHAPAAEPGEPEAGEPYPESLTAELPEEQEEWLAETTATLWPEDEYAEITPEGPGAP